MAPKTFSLIRERDLSGISGTGIVAEGVEFKSGVAVLSWFGKYRTTAVYNNVDELMAIHGHEGATSLVWDPIPTVHVKPKISQF